MKKLFVFLFVMCLTLPAYSENITLPQAKGTTLNGAQSGDYTGMVMTHLGDIDGDFFPNVAIAAPRYLPGASWGAVYLLSGKPDGLPASIDLKTIDQTGFGNFITGEMAGVYYGGCIGENVVNIGDRNGDKLNETLISARCNGEIRILNGSKTMPKKFRISDIGTTVAPGLVIKGLPNNNKYQVTVGDFNGDKKNEIFIAGFATGEILMLDGASLPTTGTITITPSYFDGVTGVRFMTPMASGNSNNYVTLADMNRDGKKDLVAANVANIKIYIKFGQAEQLPGQVNLNDQYLNGTTGAVLYTAVVSNARSVYAVSDINGDNFDDVITRGEQYPNKKDAVAIFGKAVWPAFEDLNTMIDGKKASIIRGLNGADYEARTIVPAGDFNSDGIKDAMIGDHLFNQNRGRAIIVGGMTNWPAILDLNTPNLIDGVKHMQITNPNVEFTGYTVEYGENLFGGIGCGTDVAYLVGAPVFGQGLGKAYITSIKR